MADIGPVRTVHITYMYTYIGYTWEYFATLRTLWDHWLKLLTDIWWWWRPACKTRRHCWRDLCFRHITSQSKACNLLSQHYCTHISRLEATIIQCSATFSYHKLSLLFHPMSTDYKSLVITTPVIPVNVHPQCILIFGRLVAHGAPDRATCSVYVPDVDAQATCAGE